MQFEVVRFLVGPEASKDQSQTDFGRNTDTHFWAQQPPSITVKLSEFCFLPRKPCWFVFVVCGPGSLSPSSGNPLSEQ